VITSQLRQLERDGIVGRNVPRESSFARIMAHAVSVARQLASALADIRINYRSKGARVREIADDVARSEQQALRRWHSTPTRQFAPQLPRLGFQQRP
jgi:DNA-binding HxlR family transcriptional regulator